jgi:MATE family multidrug resistance protein
MTLESKARALTWRQRPFAEVLRLAWPIAVSLLSFTVMTAVDTLFIGHLGPAALAGVALAGSSTFTLLCFGMGLLRSTNITIAQAVGAGQEHAVRAYLGAGLMIAFGIGLLTALAGQVVAMFVPALTSSAESGVYAATYMRVRVLGAPIQLVTIAMAAARYATGDSRAPMQATLTANAANVLLVSLFSLGFHAGVAGIATATVLSQFVEVSVLARSQRHAGFGLRAWTGADARVLLKMGVPLGIERFFDVASFSLMVALMARMGDRELAAFQIAQQALLFGFMPAMAIGDATTVLVGQAVGARSLRTVPRVQRAAIGAGLAVIAGCSAVYLGCAPLIAAQFSDDAAVNARAVQLLHLGAGFLFAVPFYTVGQATLRAIGDVRAASLITVIAAWVCTPLFGSLFGFALGLGPVGMYIGLATELSLAAITFWWRIRGDGRAWTRNLRRFRSELRASARESAQASAVVRAA